MNVKISLNLLGSSLVINVEVLDGNVRIKKLKSNVVFGSYFQNDDNISTTTFATLIFFAFFDKQIHH